jgi:hypothetical protein
MAGVRAGKGGGRQRCSVVFFGERGWQEWNRDSRVST